ncbi:conserved hypothetical protein [Theileria orientalis strain Shintoku]|uniref:Uncharacterized protein n=1 Tax=Theileria orientalis strain Shintoku TaxID=869250 RepID=J4CDI9_THEOR|nr:conserved hypothetical protein [Theileria orientalis strain Shintoku]BAM41222.1 conserved hypothetical protein [Theileria orientalis strain Shintoku]|eukprot:XP_009691523.1 conserved hypothetical protein [Theileria orientalis strain Shintoku]
MDELFDYPDEENNDDQNDDQTQRRDSDDSFIVDDDRSVEDFEGASDNREDSNDDDYDFLFGIPQEDKAEEENKVKRRVKDLEKLLSSRAGAYDEFEGTEDEIRYTLEDLSYFYKSRQALELELLSLFSGLIKREKISQTKNHMKSSKEYQATNVENLFTDRETARKDDGNKNKFQKYNINKRKQSEKTMNKFLKNIIKQTFRNDQPEGRFGRFSKDKENASHLRSMDTGYEGDENVLVTIDSEAVANLRDINTLLHRERRGDYEEMEGVPLYKYPRCASIYIFSHNFMSSFILPLCSVLNRGSVSEAIDVDQLVNELIYFFYQITQPPSENWYNYWMTAQSIYKVINLQLLQSLGKDSQDAPNRSFKGDEEKNSNVKIELKYRTRVIDSYIKGLNTLRSAMESSEIWSIIGEFRLKLEHFKQNGYISKEDLEELNSMKELQQSLSTERDNLIKEVEQLEEEEDRSELNRLRKDRELAQEVRNAAMAKKKRIKQIRRELYDVTTNINEVNKRVDATRTKSEFHMQTVRILISQVLTIKSNMGMLYIFNELGILTLIRQELLMFFRTIRKAIVPVTYVPDQTVDPGASKTDENAVPEQQHEEKGDYEYYPSYLTQLERNMLWQYVRIVYNILSGINVTSLLGEVKGVKGEDKAHGERDSKEGGGSSSSSRDTGSSTNRVNGSGNRNGHQQQGVNNYKSRDQLLEERDRMERSYLIEMYRMNPKLYNKFNDRVFSYNVRSANYNQKNNYHYTFKYSHTTGGSNEATREEKDKESLQNELNLLIGINSSLEHISFSNNTAREGEVVAEKKEVDYELVLMLLVCCYDINREVDEEYYEPYDRLILFNIKSFVIRYYSMVYVKHSAKKAPKTMPTSLLFLAIKRYIGEDNIFTKLLLTYLNQLVKKLNYQNNQVIIQLIQNAHTELSFIQSFHTSASLSGKETSGSKDDGGVANGNVDGDGGEGSGGSDPKRDKEQAEMEEEYINNICKEFFVEYIKNNIRLMMFNLLKNFKMSYNRVLFVSSLRLVLLLEKLALKIGAIEFVPITGYSSNERLLGKDLDDEFWDEEDEDREEDTWDPKGRKKLVRVDERNIYNCKNNNFVRNDILRNGRIVHNAMLLLLSRNSRGKDVLLAYLDKVPRALLYDFKYFLLINSHLNNSVPTVNTSRGLNLGTRFGMRKEQAAGAKTENALFMEIVESFMDKWLLEDNKVMLLELFLNKNVATVSASTSRVNYNINSKFYIDPIESNDYLNCPIVQGVMDQDQEDIVDIMANLSISKEEQKVERKAKIDDQLLLQYYNRFKYMNEGVVKYLSDLLNIPAKQLQRHLDELLETNAGAGVGSGTGPGGVQDGVEEVSKHTRKGASGGAKYDKESLIRVMARFYAEHKDDALDVMREMHENLLESAEMYKLSGLEVEVIEPIQLTEELKRSGHYEKLLAHLNVEEATNVLKGVEGLEPKLEALREFVESPFLPKAEENEVEAAEADQEWEEVVDVHNVTSKDIIKLLIDLSSLYDFENDDDLFDEGEPPKVSAEVDGTLVPEVEPQQQQVPEQQQPTVPEQPVLEQPYEEQQPPVLEQQQPTLPDLQQPPVREHQTVLEQKVDKQRRYELILEEERKKINELLDVCFDIISNSDKSDYVRYYSFSNMHQDELKVSDASEGDYGMDVDVKFEKLNVSRELLMRKLLKYCNIEVKNNIIKLVDNKVNPEIVKNRLNIIKSLHKLSKLQLIDILSRQQEQTMGHDNEVEEPDFEENMAKYDNEAQEHTFDYSGMDFSKKKTPRRGVSRSIDVDKGDEYDNRDFDKDHGADKDDKGDQESLSGFRKKLDKVKKVQGKRTVKESKRKKKLKKSQLGDAEELDNENEGGDDASVDYNDSFEAKLAENDGERPTDRYGVHQTKKLVEGAKTSKQTAGKQPKQPRKQRQKRKLGEEVHPETQPTAREHEELGDGFDYRSLVGVKTRDSAVDKVEREHIRELAGFKRVPDIVIEIHNRSLALAKEQKLSNSMNYKRLMEYTSAIS